MTKTTVSEDDVTQLLSDATAEMEPFLDVDYAVDVRLGSAKMTVDQLLKLSPGDVVSLDRVSSGYVEVAVGGVRIGEAEVLVRKRGSAARLVKID